MSPLQVFVALALLSVGLGLSLPAAATSRQRAGCVRVRASFSTAKSGCGKKKQERVVRFDISVPPASAKGSVTLRCLDKKVAVEVSVRTKKCLKILLGRCKCLRDARKEGCIQNQVAICAGKNEVDLG